MRRLMMKGAQIQSRSSVKDDCNRRRCNLQPPPLLPATAAATWPHVEVLLATRSIEVGVAGHADRLVSCMKKKKVTMRVDRFRRAHGECHASGCQCGPHEHMGQEHRMGIVPVAISRPFLAWIIPTCPIARREVANPIVVGGCLLMRQSW